MLDLVTRGKYEITAAGFAAIDRLDQIEISKKMQGRKVAVQIMDLLQKDEVHYYYKDKIREVGFRRPEEEAYARLKAMPSGTDVPEQETMSDTTSEPSVVNSENTAQKESPEDSERK
jgi:hypothetical protein